MTEKCTRVPVRVGEDAGVSEDETIGGSEALGYLPLEHTCTAGDALPIVEHAEEDL